MPSCSQGSMAIRLAILAASRGCWHDLTPKDPTGRIPCTAAPCSAPTHGRQLPAEFLRRSIHYSVEAERSSAHPHAQCGAAQRALRTRRGRQSEGHAGAHGSKGARAELRMGGGQTVAQGACARTAARPRSAASREAAPRGEGAVRSPCPLRSEGPGVGMWVRGMKGWQRGASPA